MVFSGLFAFLFAVVVAVISFSFVDYDGLADIVHPRSKIERAQDYMKDGYYERAANVLRDIPVKDRTADDYLNMGYAYQQLGRTDVAIKAYQRGLELNPRHPWILFYIGQYYLSAGDLNRAVDVQNRLLGACGNMCEAYQRFSKQIEASQKKVKP